MLRTYDQQLPVRHPQLAKSDDYLAAFFMDDYIGGRFSSTSAVGGAVLSLAFGPEVFARFLEGAAAEDKPFRK